MYALQESLCRCAPAQIPGANSRAPARAVCSSATAQELTLCGLQEPGPQKADKTHMAGQTVTGGLVFLSRQKLTRSQTSPGGTGSDMRV
jgi:hypothetical protein